MRFLLIGGLVLVAGGYVLSTGWLPIAGGGGAPSGNISGYLSAPSAPVNATKGIATSILK